jgi:type II secretory pathway pseudopilin PulG
LIELLVVIAIVAILSVVVILVLNPAELVRQARDSNRLQDLGNINTALNLFQTDTGGTLSMGLASTTYVSIPDPLATSTAGTNCASLGLPGLPSGWSYHCAASSTYRLVNGTGWIPVDLTVISFKSPLALLPVDPVNQTSSRNYYTYTPGGSWELATSFEAARNKLGGAADKVSKDGGSYPDLYETGTNLTLLPVDYGDTSLVGYWKFDEGSGTSAYDASGRGKTGTFYGGATWASTGSCKVGGCLSSPNPSGGDRVEVPNNGTFNFGSGGFTIMGWVKIPQPPQYGCGIFGNYAHSGNNGDLSVGIDDNRTSLFISHTNLSGQRESHGYNFSSYFSQWTHIAWEKDGSNILLFINGNQVLSGAITISYNVSLYTNVWYITATDWCNPLNTSWFVDEHRVYSRALSAAEIAAIYNATE